jgi:hypothetical protein
MTAPERSTYEQLYAAMLDVLGGEYQDYLAVFSPESAEQPAALRDSVFAADNTTVSAAGPGSSRGLPPAAAMLAAPHPLWGMHSNCWIPFWL